MSATVATIGTSCRYDTGAFRSILREWRKAAQDPEERNRTISKEEAGARFAAMGIKVVTR